MKRRCMTLIFAVISILVISLIGFLAYRAYLDPRYWGVGYIEETGGMCYVSEIYDAGDNTSYVVYFHNVTFTFMYWTYPQGAYDADYTAYCLIEFPDNTSEIITFYTGSDWRTSGLLRDPLTAAIADHTSPLAGVLYHGYLDYPCGWQFFVSIE